MLKKDYLIIVCVGIIASGAISNGLVIWQQGQQLNEMMRVVTQDMYSAYQTNAVLAAASSSEYAAGAIEEGFVRIGHGETELNNKEYRIEHWCKGSVFSGMDERDNKMYQYCLGDNKLISIIQEDDESQSVYVEAKMRADLPADAPVLFGISVVPTSANYKEQWITIQFSQDACITVGSCSAVERDLNHISYAMHIGHEGHERHILKNIPLTGTPVWNPDGLHAFMVPSGCMEEGCNPLESKVYSLESDTMKKIGFSRTGSNFRKDAIAIDEFVWKGKDEFSFRAEYKDGSFEFLEGFINE